MTRRLPVDKFPLRIKLRPMKKSEVVIGEKYIAKVSEKMCVVRIDSIGSYGGWNATNLDTGRQIHIRIAMRLRRKWTEPRPVPKFCCTNCRCPHPNGNCECKYSDGSQYPCCQYREVKYGNRS